MDDQVLIQILETACRDENLVFQVIEQERHLHVFLNREPGQILNYKRVGRKIYQALTPLSLTDIDGVCLYSRILGEEEPDWEAKFRLPQAQPEPVNQQPVNQGRAAQSAPSVQSETQRQMSEAATYVMQDVSALRAEAKQAMAMAGGGAPPTVVTSSAATAEAAPSAEAANYPLSDRDGVTEAAAAYEAAGAAAPTVSVVAATPLAQAQPATMTPPLDEDFNLAEHCFIRNRMLLKADILPPSKTVATQLNRFHEFDLAEKQRMMPQLELFFKGAPTFSAEGLTESQQAWFRDLEALAGDDARKGPIWLSRYCANAGATLDVVARVLDPSLDAVNQDDKSGENVDTDEPGQHDGTQEHEADLGRAAQGGKTAVQTPPQRMDMDRPGRQSPSRSASHRQQGTDRAHPAVTRPSSSMPPWLMPVILGVMAAMCFFTGFFIVDSPASDLCRGTSGDPQYCQLAADMTGETFLAEMVDFAEPVAISATTQAQNDCEQLASLHVGQSPAEIFERGALPISSSTMEQIFPGVFMADVQHQDLPAGQGSTRTACLVVHSANAVEIMHSDVIPNAWPNETYGVEAGQAQTGNIIESMMRTAEYINPPMMLGANLLFTALGMWGITALGLGMQARSLNTVCGATLVFCLVEALFSLLPLKGLIGLILWLPRKVAVFTAMKSLVKDLRVHNDIIAMVGIVLMSMLRAILTWALFAGIFASSFLGN